MPLSKIFDNLPKATQNYLSFLAYFELYFTIESTILTQFLNAVQKNTSFESIEESTFKDCLLIAKRCGWISVVSGTKIMKINPVFTFFIKKKKAKFDYGDIQKSFIDFYSAYCNFLILKYFNDSNNDLKIEGLKVALYEFYNFSNALQLSIIRQEEFIHFFHLLDNVLELQEFHKERLLLAIKTNDQIEKISNPTIETKIQQTELKSFTGDIYYRLGKTEDAILYYTIALKKFRASNLFHNESMVLNNLANIYVDSFNLEKAISYYKNAIQSLINVPDEIVLIEKREKTLIGMYLNLGHCFYQNLDYKKAEKYYYKALELAKNIEEDLQIGMLNEKLGLIAYRKRQYKKAVEFYKTASNYFNQIEYTFGIGSLSINMGLVMSDIGKIENALDAYKTALEIFLFLNIPQKIAEAHNNIAYILYQKKEFDDANDHYIECLNIAKPLQMEGTIGRCSIGLGSICLENDEFKEALNYFNEAKSIFKKRNELDCLGDTYLNLSTTHLLTNKFEDCKIHANLAIPIFRKLSNTKNHASTLSNLAKVSIELKEFELAIQYFHDAAKLTLNNSPLLSCEYYQQAGLLAYENHLFQEAEQYYKEALQLAKQIKEFEMEAWINRSLGYISDDQDKHQQAKNYFLNAYNLFESLDSKEEQADLAQILGVYFTELKSPNSAITYFRKAFNIYLAIEDKEGIEAAKDNRQTFFDMTGIWFEFD